MAPVVEPIVVTIFPWPHFSAYKDNLPLIGGKLYTYQPETSTPKAAFKDPGFITAHENPITLRDQGDETIYLNGFYALRLCDEEDVLLWEVPLFSFATGAPPMPGTIVTGSTEATVPASPGASVITVPNAAPAGYRVKGCTSTNMANFGTSGGLTAFAIGDGTLLNRWALQSNLSAGAQTSQLNFQAGDEPVSTVAYTVLISAIGGTFDSNGSLHITTFWESLSTDVP